MSLTQKRSEKSLTEATYEVVKRLLYITTSNSISVGYICKQIYTKLKGLRAQFNTFFVPEIHAVLFKENDG